MKLLISLLTCFLLLSCGNKERFKVQEDGDLVPPPSQKNRASGSDSVGEDSGEDLPEIVFADVLSEVFETSCKSCHAEYLNYERVKKDLNSILREVFADRMPKFAPPLSVSQKMLLEDWADLGAPQN